MSSEDLAFKFTVAELAEICNFDNRTEPRQLEYLKTTLGGVEGVAVQLKSDVVKGLHLKNPYHRPDSGKPKGSKNAKLPTRDSRCADESVRLAYFGENIIPPPPSESILQIIIGTVMDDPILKVLIVGAIVVLALGTATCPSTGWTEGLAIVVAVFLVLGVTAGNDYSKDRKFKKLMLLQTDKKCRIIRGGEKFEISSWDIFVGDVIELVVGDEVPADGLFISGNSLLIDESPLTGETLPVKKDIDMPFIYSGCQVSEGTGYMLVTAVGINSNGGKIQEMLNEAQNEMTPLQEKLKDVAILIGKAGVASGIVTFLGLAIRWGIAFAYSQPLTGSCATAAGGTSSVARVVALAEDFVVAITIVVVAVPEGLPLAVTLALSLSMFKMMREKCFVRHLDAAETMGQATTICTDKTGTLTYNRMTVVRLMIKDRIYKGEGSGDKDAMPFSTRTLSIPTRDLITEGCCVNSNCFIKNEEQVNNGAAVPIFVGSATEGATLVMCKKFGVNYRQVREKAKVLANGVWTFSAERKRMSTIVYHADSGKYRMHTKGASEIILGLCTQIFDPEANHPIAMTDTERANIAKNITAWASEGLRTIALAFKVYEHGIDNSMENSEEGLIFLSLLAIKDPLRKEIPAAVATCQRAGIVVRMVTGDNILTATKIAKEANIFYGDGIAMEGPAFRVLSKEEQIKILPNLQVFRHNQILARCSPADKFNLVCLLQEMGEVVAATGDGTNDAPALKQADVGFSMGICGTQVAMNASDIVLLDDNFASIVSATRWGRNVLNTIRKFLQFQLGINIAAIVITFVGAVTTGSSPLSTIQLLLVNLIMDSLGAIALASDEPDDDILLQPPQRRTDPILNGKMIEYIALQSVFQTSAILLVLFGTDSLVPVDYTYYKNPLSYTSISGNPSKRATSMVFAAFILMQLTNLICARNLNGELNMFSRFFNNQSFLLVLASITAILVIAITLVADAFNAVSLSGTEWLICIIIALINIPLVFLYRLASRFVHSYLQRRQKKIGARVGSTKMLYAGAKEDDIEFEQLVPAPVAQRAGFDDFGPLDSRKKPVTDIESGSVGNSRAGSVVEIFRKIKVDYPIPTKAQSNSSLNRRISSKVLTTA